MAAPGSTRHLEISLAAIHPSCSNEDRIPSSRLQGSQLPPEVSGMALCQMTALSSLKLQTLRLGMAILVPWRPEEWQK
jgi:hypothetical protein